jgi:hypothetical protein
MGMSSIMRLRSVFVFRNTDIFPKENSYTRAAALRNVSQNKHLTAHIIV